MGGCHPEPTDDEFAATTRGLELELQGIFVSASISLFAKNSLSCFLRRNFELEGAPLLRSPLRFLGSLQMLQQIGGRRAVCPLSHIFGVK